MSGISYRIQLKVGIIDEQRNKKIQMQKKSYGFMRIEVL